MAESVTVSQYVPGKVVILLDILDTMKQPLNLTLTYLCLLCPQGMFNPNDFR